MTFLDSQSRRRILNKAWDGSTAHQAMATEITDSLRVLEVSKNSRRVIRTQCRKILDGKSYRVRKLFRNINMELEHKWDKKQEQHTNKVLHLWEKIKLKQKINNVCKPKPTLVPERLAEYESLSIFGTPDKLSEPEPTVHRYV